MEKKTIQLKELKIGEGRPAIAVPLVAANMQELKKAIDQAQEGGAHADLVEYRADFDLQVLADETRLREVLGLIRETISDKPVLFTVRTALEGGRAALSFDAYQRVLLWAADSHLADLIDVELFTAGDQAAQLVEQIHQRGAYVIGSSHDFASTPSIEEMIRRIEMMQRCDMDITKLAVMPCCRLDVIRLLEAAVRIDETVADRPCVTMSMGRDGVISRVSGTFTGSAITFATAGRASAPGQIPADELFRVLRVLGEE